MNTHQTQRNLIKRFQRSLRQKTHFDSIFLLYSKMNNYSDQKLLLIYAGSLKISDTRTGVRPVSRLLIPSRLAQTYSGFQVFLPRLRFVQIYVDYVLRLIQLITTVLELT